MYTNVKTVYVARTDLKGDNDTPSGLILTSPVIVTGHPPIDGVSKDLRRGKLDLMHIVRDKILNV